MSILVIHQNSINHSINKISKIWFASLSPNTFGLPNSTLIHIRYANYR